MNKCDCLNDCGDDPRVKAGTAEKCSNWERLHRYDSDDRDAARYRFLCENPDWTFMERICQQFPAQTATEFYQRLSAVIDRLRRPEQNNALIRRHAAVQDRRFAEQVDAPTCFGGMGELASGGIEE